MKTKDVEQGGTTCALTQLRHSLSCMTLGYATYAATGAWTRVETAAQTADKGERKKQHKIAKLLRLYGKFTRV